MKKKNLWIGIIVLIIGLSIGYAVLSANLNINGTSHINNAAWNIYWDNVQVTTGSVTASTPTISSGTTVSYNVTLTNPGDFYEFTVDAVNDGSINAIIDSITTTLNDGPMTSLPSYLNYSLTNDNGDEIAVNQELNSGETKTYKLRIEYKKDVNQNQLPTTDEDLEIKVVIVYVQNPNPPTIPDETVDPTELVYTYTGATIEIGSPIPDDVQTIDTLSGAVAAYIHDGFIGIKLEGDIVKELYIVVNYYGDTYFMRGGIDPSSPKFANNYNKNKSLITEITGEENCYTITDSYSCGEPGRPSGNGYYFQITNIYFCSLYEGYGCYLFHDGTAACNI